MWETGCVLDGKQAHTQQHQVICGASNFKYVYVFIHYSHCMSYVENWIYFSTCINFIFTLFFTIYILLALCQVSESTFAILFFRFSFVSFSRFLALSIQFYFCSFCSQLECFLCLRVLDCCLVVVVGFFFLLPLDSNFIYSIYLLLLFHLYSYQIHYIITSSKQQQYCYFTRLFICFKRNAQLIDSLIT